MVLYKVNNSADTQNSSFLQASSNPQHNVNFPLNLFHGNRKAAFVSTINKIKQNNTFFSNGNKVENSVCDKCEVRKMIDRFENMNLRDYTTTGNKEIAQKKEVQQKFKVGELKLENGCAKQLLNSLCQDLEDPKTVLPLEKRTFANSDTVNQIQHISNHVKNLQKHLNYKESEIDVLRAENETFRSKLTVSEEHIKNLKIEALQQIEAMKNQHLEEIVEKNKKLDDLSRINQNLLRDSKQSLIELNKYAKLFKDKSNALETMLNQEVARNNRLRKELLDLTNKVNNQESRLANERQKFTFQLNEVSNKMVFHCRKVNIQDVKKEAQNEYIRKAVKKIYEIQSNVEKYEEQIRKFEGDRDDKKYSHIKEMLLRAIEKLDGIESRRLEEIQTKRKESVGYVKGLQDEFERRLIIKNINFTSK